MTNPYIQSENSALTTANKRGDESSLPFLSNNSKARRAFTLIELLVVIAIIGLLSSGVLASLSGTREAARDSRRKQDINQIRNALALHYNKHNTFVVRDYSDSPEGERVGRSGDIGKLQTWFNANSSDGGTWRENSVAEALANNGEMGSVVEDPSGKRTEPGAYLIYAEKNHYTVWVSLENPSDDDTATQDGCYYDIYDNNFGGNYCVGS